MSFFQSLHLNTNNSRTTRTFKPNTASSPPAHLLRQYADATLGAGSLAQAVKLPEGEDLAEWLAVNTVDFYNQVNMLYSTITSFCSPASCPRMTATDEYEYLWQNAASEKFRKPTRVSAPEYIEHLVSWVQAQLDDEAVFPHRLGAPFPKNFVSSVVPQILKRLFRVYAHIYCHHFDQISELGLQPHLNTSLKHFVLFSKEFGVVDSKEFAPLDELIQILLDDKS